MKMKLKMNNEQDHQGKNLTTISNKKSLMLSFNGAKILTPNIEPTKTSKDDELGGGKEKP
jgi:hypothetical protein